MNPSPTYGTPHSGSQCRLRGCGPPNHQRRMPRAATAMVSETEVWAQPKRGVKESVAAAVPVTAGIRTKDFQNGGESSVKSLETLPMMQRSKQHSTTSHHPQQMRRQMRCQWQASTVHGATEKCGAGEEEPPPQLEREKCGVCEREAQTADNAKAPRRNCHGTHTKHENIKFLHAKDSLHFTTSLTPNLPLYKRSSY